MSVDTTATYDQGNLAPDDVPVDEYHENEPFDPQAAAEQELWHLQRELNQAKLALQAEIWDLRAEVQTLRLNAIRAAGRLEKIVSQILNSNTQSPYDPTC